MGDDWCQTSAEWQRAVLAILDDYARRWQWTADRFGLATDGGRDSACAAAAFRAAIDCLNETSEQRRKDDDG